MAGAFVLLHGQGGVFGGIAGQRLVQCRALVGVARLQRQRDDRGVCGDGLQQQGMGGVGVSVSGAGAAQAHQRHNVPGAGHGDLLAPVGVYAVDAPHALILP